MGISYSVEHGNFEIVHNLGTNVTPVRLHLWNDAQGRFGQFASRTLHRRPDLFISLTFCTVFPRNFDKVYM